MSLNVVGTSQKIVLEHFLYFAKTFCQLIIKNSQIALIGCGVKKSQFSQSDKGGNHEFCQTHV